MATRVCKLFLGIDTIVEYFACNYGLYIITMKKAEATYKRKKEKEQEELQKAASSSYDREARQQHRGGHFLFAEQEIK